MPGLVQIGRVVESAATSAAVGDEQLIAILDIALAEAAVKSGDWLKCRPGCMQCCVGAFEINQLDARRLREGMELMKASDPERAARIQRRAEAYVARLAAEFPGDLGTGIVFDGAEAEEQFERFANDEVCPALDPDNGTCDVYAARPMTCRAFGPPIRSEGGLGVCELCFHGATDEEIAACEMEVDPDGLEEVLLERLRVDTGGTGRTVVAYCLVDSLAMARD